MARVRAQEMRPICSSSRSAACRSARVQQHQVLSAACSRTEIPSMMQCAMVRCLSPCSGSAKCCFSLSYNGNPLVDVRTGARHADGRLSGLWSRHGLKKGTRVRAGRFTKYQTLLKVSSPLHCVPRGRARCIGAWPGGPRAGSALGRGSVGPPGAGPRAGPPWSACPVLAGSLRWGGARQRRGQV
jgi:hypothetical protein